MLTLIVAARLPAEKQSVMVEIRQILARGLSLELNTEYRVKYYPNYWLSFPVWNVEPDRMVFLFSATSNATNYLNLVSYHAAAAVTAYVDDIYIWITT